MNKKEAAEKMRVLSKLVTSWWVNG